MTKGGRKTQNKYTAIANRIKRGDRSKKVEKKIENRKTATRRDGRRTQKSSCCARNDVVGTYHIRHTYVIIIVVGIHAAEMKIGKDTRLPFTKNEKINEKIKERINK